MCSCNELTVVANITKLCASQGYRVADFARFPWMHAIFCIAYIAEKLSVSHLKSLT